MSVQSVSEVSSLYPVNTIKALPQNNFKVDLKEPVDSVEFSQKQQSEKPSTVKKIGVGMASVMLPGLGQFINGDTKKGIGFLAVNFALVPFAGPFVTIANIALQVASGVDAVRNVK